MSKILDIRHGTKLYSALVNNFSSVPSIHTRGIGPAVRSLLELYNIDISNVPTSGPHGIPLKGDVLKYLKETGAPKQVHVAPPPVTPATTHTGLPPSDTAARPAAVKPAASPVKPPALEQLAETEHYIDIPASNMRMVIAKRLTLSKTTIPHSYASIDCKMEKAQQLRRDLIDDGVKVSVNDFIIKAAAVALQKVPEVNAVWSGDSAQMLGNIDVCVAVATDSGLITPIVKDAIHLGVEEISSSVKDLATRARSGKLKPEEFQGGSFTISNLGMYGISSFSAVINPPQACILAVGSSRRVLQADGEIETVMTVTLSADGRIVDDTLAAKFLDTFREIMENPMLMLSQGLNVDIEKLFAK